MSIHNIVVEIDPGNAKAGMAQVDGALKRSGDEAKAFAREAQEAMRSVEKAAKEAAREQERAAKAAARASATAQKQAAREVDETARALTIAAERRARERAQVEADAARAAAAAAKLAAAEREKAEQFAAKRTADYAAMVSRDRKAAQDRLAQSYRTIVGPAAEYREKLNQIIQLERQGAITATQRANAIRGMQREIQQFNAKQQGGVRGAVSEIASSQFGAVAGPAAAAAVALKAGQELVRLGDDYTSLTNKVKASTNSEAEAIRVRERLFKTANDARVPVEALTNLYAQARIATKDLGTSQGELIRVSELLSKATRGVAETNRSAGLQQFGQALTKGKLQAEELMSIMENIPKVGVLLAQGMGMTVGELRKAAEAGKVGTQEMLDAIQRMGPAIEQEFAKSAGTSAESWAVFKNQVLQTAGEFTEQIHLNEMLTDVLGQVGEALKGIGTLVKGTVDNWKAINDATGGWLGKLVKAPGLLGRVAELQGMIAGQYLFGAEMLERQATWAAKLTREAEKQTAELNKQLTALSTSTFFSGYSKDGKGRATGYGVVGNFVRDSIDASNSPIRQRIDKQEEREAAAAARDHATAVREAAAEKERSLRAYESLNASLSVTYRAELDISKAEETLADAVERGWVTREKADQILARYTATLEDALDPYARAIEKLRDEARVLGLSAAERAHGAAVMALELDLRKKGVELNADQILALERAVDAQEDAAKASEQHNAQLARQQAVYDEVYGPAIKYQQTVEALTAEAARGAITQEQLAFYTAKAKAAFDAATPSVVKMTPLVQQMNDEFAAAGLTMGKFGDMIGQRLAGALDQTLDAVVDFANGSKVSFSDLARSVLADIEKMIIKLLVFQGIKAALGGVSGAGGIVSAIGSALGFNAGNNAGGGSYVVPNVGGGGVDSVPIFARATPGEHVTFTPAGQRPGGDAAPQPVNVNAYIFHDQEAATLAAMNTPAGTRAIISAIAANPGAVRAAVGR